MIKKFVYRNLVRSGMQTIFLHRLRGTITVLTYHGIIEDSSEFHAWTLVPASNFEKQLQYLKANFHLISMDEAVSLCEKDYYFRPKAVITFDDGMRNNISVALPILEQYKVPATIYISTKAVLTGQAFWWDRIIQAIESSKTVLINLRNFGLGLYSFDSGVAPHLCWTEIQRLLEDLKLLMPMDREDAVETILEHLGVGDAQRFSSFAPLTVEEVKRMSSSPLICIGSHTHCHSILTQLPRSEAQESIESSLVLLRKWTQRPIHHFSYPNGNYNKEIISIIKRSGIKTAVTTKKGRCTFGLDPFQIPRVEIGGYDGMEVFKARILGVVELFGNIRACMTTGK